MGIHPVLFLIAYLARQNNSATTLCINKSLQRFDILEMRVTADLELHVGEILHHGHKSVEILLFPHLPYRKEELLSFRYKSRSALLLLLYVLNAVVYHLQTLAIGIYMFHYFVLDII